MSTVQRRRGKSLHLELPGGLPDDRPPIVALFLIRFDVKAGYTIVWKKSRPDLTLSDSVEFKSLPSGLHNVKDDLVYFMHGSEHAGISAFVNKSTDKYERNALMLAVGALVPLDNGRLGKSWKHADKLKELAEQLVQDPGNVRLLEDYWEEHHLQNSTTAIDSRPGSSSDTSNHKSRDRLPSMASALTGMPTTLSPYHPALALPSMIDSFGPLIFPLYKAALLRKRILLMHEAPVQLACNFVYNISILSNIPSSVVDLIPLEPLPKRLQPLFSVGVHDLDELSHHGKRSEDQDDPGYGWIACSTDNVLTIKTSIYDILVNLPASNPTQARQRIWPHVYDDKGQELKASQRDLRRYRTLRQSIRRAFPHSRLSSPLIAQTQQIIPQEEDDNSDESATLLPSQPPPESYNDASSTSDLHLIEPLSWSALAYHSFMWWASAGEKTAGLEEEIEQDSSMFRDFNSSYVDTPGSAVSGKKGRRKSNHSMVTPGMGEAPEMAIIAFFHRLTAGIFTVLSKAVENSTHIDDEADNQDSAHVNGDVDEEIQPPVYITGEDLTRMGLDVWSEADKKFVEELVELYWGRKADVQGGTIECCGVRIL